MQKMHILPIFFIIFIALLSTACGSPTDVWDDVAAVERDAHVFLASEIRGSLTGHNAPYIRGDLKIIDQEQIAVPLARLSIYPLLELGARAVDMRSMAWLDDDNLLIKFQNNLDFQPYEDTWIAFYTANVTTGSFEYLYHFETTNLSMINHAIKEGNTIRIALFNGDFFEFEDGGLVEHLKGSTDESLSTHELTIRRNIYTKELIYFNYQTGGVYNQSTGDLLYSFNLEQVPDIGPRLMQISPDGRYLVFAYVFDIGTVLRTVFVNLETKEVREIIRNFSMPAYFWIDSELFIIEENFDTDPYRTYMVIRHGPDFEYEIIIQNDTLGSGSILNNYTLFNLGGSSGIIPMHLIEQVTPFDQVSWPDMGHDTLLFLFSMEDGIPQITPIYRSAHQDYREFAINPSGTRIAFNNRSFLHEINSYIVVSQLVS